MAVKAVIPSHFSLITFATAQVIIDLQPLAVRLGAGGSIHGWTHSFLAALGLGLVSALIGKVTAPWLFYLLSFGSSQRNRLPWRTAILSGLVGSLSHVLLDALIYADMNPFWPFFRGNPLFLLQTKTMIAFCLISGGFGLAVYFARKIGTKASHS